MITYIFDHGMKYLCLSFHLVQILVIYGYGDIIEIVHIPLSVNHIFNVFMNIYEYANLIICICNMEIIGLCLSFNLVIS